MDKQQHKAGILTPNSIWRGSADQEPAVRLPIDQLAAILSTASLLRTAGDDKAAG